MKAATAVLYSKLPRPPKNSRYHSMGSEIKVVFSSINVARTPHALKSPKWLGAFAAGANCSGVEYMPQFDKLVGHTPRALGRAVASGELDLNSLHAGFRETPHSANTQRMIGEPLPRDAMSRLMGSPLGRIILPEAVESARVMAEIQRHAGKDVPVVLYPQALTRDDRAQIAAAAGTYHLFQPRDQTANLVGSTTIEAFDDKMANVRGYGYVLDTFHVRRRYGHDEPGIISTINASVPVMGTNIRAVHLSLNRTDIPGEPHIPTEAEGRDALNGRYTGELRYMLNLAKALGEVEYAVIETEYDAVRSLTGHDSASDIQKDYADIADGFREFWAQPA